MWFSSFSEPRRHSQPLPSTDQHPQAESSESTSPANSVESLPNPQTSNAVIGSPKSTVKRSSSASASNEVTSSPKKRKVKFRPQKVPTKQFSPSCALLIKSGSCTAKSNKPRSKKKNFGVINLSEEIAKEILNNNDKVRERIDHLLASGYSKVASFLFTKSSSGYVLTSTNTQSKRNSALTPEPCPSEVAKFSLAFDPYKVVTISFPQPIFFTSPSASPSSRNRPSSRSSSRSNSASTIPRGQTMLPISTPSGSERTQSFVFEGATYAWHYNTATKQEPTSEATLPVDKALCSLYLTKQIDSISSTSPRVVTDVVCARFLRKPAWKKKDAVGAIVIDEAKIDSRIALVTLMVVLKREARGKFAKVVALRHWR